MNRSNECGDFQGILAARASLKTARRIGPPEVPPGCHRKGCDAGRQGCGLESPGQQEGARRGMAHGVTLA
jgi:hypothetical protein